MQEEAPVGLNETTASESLMEKTNELTVIHQNDASEVLEKISVPTSLLKPTPSDVENFLQRPLIISSFDESFLSDGLIHTIELSDYFLNTLIIEKLKGFNYLKADFNVRINLTAPAYAYGGVAVSYMYNTTANLADVVDPVVYMTSRVKQFIDLSQNQSLDITIPFSHPYDFYDISSLNITTLRTRNVFPKLLMCRVTPLLNALDGGNAEYRMTVYTYFNNITLAIPNLFNLQSSKEKKQIKKPGQISTVATAFEKGLSTISTLPVVGPIAASGAMLAKGIGSLASAFGFSRPRDPDDHTTIGYTPHTISQGVDQVRVLSSDPNITTDMTLYNDIDGDSLTAQNLLCRAGAITSGTITQDTNVAIPVTPFVITNNAGSGSLAYRTNLNPLSALSLTHKYWSGTIIYTFRIFASKYHRGRVRIAWMPRYSTYNDTDVALRTQSTLIEVDGSTTVDIEVGWGHSQPYLPIYSCNISNPDTFNNNGFLMYAAMEPFVAPASTAPVYVVIEARAGADFDLMEPTTSFLQYFHRWPQANYTDDPLIVPATPAFVENPDVNNLPNYVTNLFVQASTESGPAKDNNVAVHNIITHSFNAPAGEPFKKYHGERFTSFRNLLKRKVPTQLLGAESENEQMYMAFVTAFPVSNTPVSDASVLAGAVWIQGFPNYIEYLGRFFRGWHGGMRLSFNTKWGVWDTNKDIIIVRANDRLLRGWSFENLDPLGSRSSMKDVAQLYHRGGDAIEFYRDINGQVANVEIPWKLPYNWLSRQNQWRTTSYYHGAYVGFCGPALPVVSHSIGEDFNFTQFLGVPTMYIYSYVPDG